ncbi:hypothetical protein Salat_1189500 [Sesamum alatum]|uniref:Reverse transcriptase zinc-binding domain-containing protein n=1 Tax=Sesamum alatum TaxID=300844 RepID=A0AAE1YFG2_9LAMI|nr:hypothetical protein Salat_1189500 [Sesamum alatum]
MEECQNALPLMANLVRQNPEVDDFCSMCKAAGEDSYHIFLSCPITHPDWALSDLPWSIISKWQGDPEAWFRNTAKECEGHEADRALIICWQLWFNMNKWLWENVGFSPSEIVSHARRILGDYTEYSLSLVNTTRTESPKREWKPPPEGHIKINFDGAMFAETNSAGVGVIAKDCIGSCLRWRARLVEFLASPEHIELIAAATALELGKEHSWN